MSNDNPTVTVNFARLEVVDSDADLSYLEQDYADVLDATERAKYLAQDAERIAAYNRSEWCMVGIRAVARITVKRAGFSTLYELRSPGTWGIESDSGEGYFQEVFEGECSTLRDDIAAMGTFEGECSTLRDDIAAMGTFTVRS